MAEARPSDTPLQVIVPAYGTSPLLTDTLASLVDVVPADVPLVVLDDASPGDDVRRQAAPFAPRVEYWRNERNLGVSGAFNAAMRRADAEYVVLVGPDDRAVPEFAQTYLAAIEQYRGAAALHPDVDTIDEHGRPWVSTGDKVKRLLRPPAGQLRGQQLAARLLIGNWTYNPAIAWRVSFVREHPFNEQLHTAMDLDLLLRLAFAGETLALVDGRALEYRRHQRRAQAADRGAGDPRRGPSGGVVPALAADGAGRQARAHRPAARPAAGVRTPRPGALGHRPAGPHRPGLTG